MKFGIRLHWGIYSIWHRGAESWPFLNMSFEDRQKYNDLYKTWNPAGFDADEWMNLFAESGLKMFAFTSKHHEGFSMFDTRTRVRQRVNWTAAGGPKIESCDLAYSIMEGPFRRDIIKELTDAAHKRNIKVDFISPTLTGMTPISGPMVRIHSRFPTPPNSVAGVPRMDRSTNSGPSEKSVLETGTS